MEGWVCPRCKASNAPAVKRCDCSALIVLPRAVPTLPMPDYPYQQDVFLPYRDDAAEAKQVLSVPEDDASGDTEKVSLQQERHLITPALRKAYEFYIKNQK